VIPVSQVMSRYCIHYLAFYVASGYVFTGVLPWVFKQAKLVTLSDKSVEDEQGIFLDSSSSGSV